MADNLHIRRPEDLTKINIGQRWEIDYWCKKLGCSENKLRIAVDAVGPSVDAVKRYLRNG